MACRPGDHRPALGLLRLLWSPQQEAHSPAQPQSGLRQGPACWGRPAHPARPPLGFSVPSQWGPRSCPQVKCPPGCGSSALLLHLCPPRAARGQGGPGPHSWSSGVAWPGPAAEQGPRQEPALQCRGCWLPGPGAPRAGQPRLRPGPLPPRGLLCLAPALQHHCWAGALSGHDRRGPWPPLSRACRPPGFHRPTCCPSAPAGAPDWLSLSGRAPSPLVERTGAGNPPCQAQVSRGSGHSALSGGCLSASALQVPWPPGGRAPETPAAAGSPPAGHRALAVCPVGRVSTGPLTITHSCNHKSKDADAVPTRVPGRAEPGAGGERGPEAQRPPLPPGPSPGLH